MNQKIINSGIIVMYFISEGDNNSLLLKFLKRENNTTVRQIMFDPFLKSLGYSKRLEKHNLSRKEISRALKICKSQGDGEIKFAVKKLVKLKNSDLKLCSLSIFMSKKLR